MQVGMLEVGPIGTNCYILFDEDKKICAVIDPGDEAHLIAASVEKSGCKLQPLKDVLLISESPAKR